MNLNLLSDFSRRSTPETRCRVVSGCSGFSKDWLLIEESALGQQKTWAAPQFYRTYLNGSGLDPSALALTVENRLTFCQLTNG